MEQPPVLRRWENQKTITVQDDNTMFPLTGNIRSQGLMFLSKFIKVPHFELMDYYSYIDTIQKAFIFSRSYGLIKPIIKTDNHDK